MLMFASTPSASLSPMPQQIADLRLAASQMTGATRRAFQAEMTLKYCDGNARRAEEVFGWGRQNVEVGLAEKQSGIVCLSLHEAFSGRPRWEDQYPQAAQALVELALAHSQQDPTFRTTVSSTRLTAQTAIDGLRQKGSEEAALPAPSTMAVILNRLGFRLRNVVKSKPLKKIPETNAIFDNVKTKNAEAEFDSTVKRWSVDWKATVKIGDFSRGGQTRGDDQAADHDFGCEEKYTPFGIADEDSAQLDLIFGSSYKTSDCIVDALETKWHGFKEREKAEVSMLQIKMDNGPESSGKRTQFLSRMVQFADAIGKPIQLLYYPPYHSKYNPIERCWGILEQHWNGTKLIDVETMLEWAKSMTWKGLHPVVELSRQVYQKGITLSKKAMKAVESRLERHSKLPKWDILIKPASTA